ncbi:MAG TPA: amidohydrolase family protein, partial [Deinococcales bacterium]|nr:amidohydrolase family protein [Deinococcales bacterium]
LAGSVLTMDEAVRNAVRAGLTVVEASHAASGAPAAYLGLEGKGRIEVGADADLVVMDRELSVRDVFVEGRRVDRG